MAPSNTVTTYIDGDISGLKRATRDASREFQNVAKAADKANTDAARGSAKALSGISRLISTGKVSAKSLDKIGKSASGAISAASGFAGGIGAALGLGALPALSDLAIKAIHGIREANKSLASRINEAAAAQRDLTLATLEAAGGLDAITAADEKAAAAHAKADKARGERRAGQKELTALAKDYTRAVRDQARAQKESRDAAAALALARKDHKDAAGHDVKAKSGAALTQLERDQTNARIAATKASERARAAEDALTDAKKRHKAPAAEVAKLDREAAAADREARLARIQYAQQLDKSDAATKKFAGTLQKEANTALKHFTNGTVAYDSQGVNYVKTTTDMIGASAAYAAQLRKHAGTAKNLTEDQKKLEESLANYVETTQTVPDDIATVVALLGQGKSVREIQEFLGQIKDVPDKTSTKVELPGVNRALGDAKGLYDSLTRLDGKRSRSFIDIITRHHDEGRKGADVATGGRIGGTPNNRDDVPVNVSQGEVILNPRQQRMVDGGMTIDGALSATGAPTVRAGGGFAAGGKSKKKKPHHGAAYRKAQVALEAARKRLRDAEQKHGKGSLEYRQAQVAVESAQAALRKASGAEKHHATEVLQDRNQRVLDSAKDRFGSTMSSDDLALATAEQTGTFTDDATVLGSERRHILARIAQIHKLRRRKGLTRQQKQDLNDEEAGLIRQLGDIGQSLKDGGSAGGGGVGGGETDEFAVDRARAEGVAQGLGRLSQYIFGGTGDIGSGGPSALAAAGGQTMMVDKLVLAPSVTNHATLANGANRGNATSNRTRTYSSRIGVAF